MSHEVTIRVVETNGLEYEADALVLKHAQGFYGFDAEVARLAGIAVEDCPQERGFRQIRSPAGLQARSLFLLGTPPIGVFSYSDVREFGRRALSAVASALPSASDIALTLHGVGFGLDEVECFVAEVAGILDALGTLDAPRGLATVTFLEINPGRAKRMRDSLTKLLGEDHAATNHRDLDTSRQLREAGAETARKLHAFVAMPFDPAFSDRFHYGIANAVRDSGLLCERIDQQAFTGDIVARLKDQITNAQFLIADVTGANANVFLEIGYAWGAGIPTVLVCEEGNSLTFDVQGQRCIFYDSIKTLEDRLGGELRTLLEDEANAKATGA